MLKVKFGTNETLMTLMLNYVALYFLIFLGETQAEWNFFLDTSSARPVFFNFGKEVAFPRIMIGKFGLNVCVLLTLLIGVLVYCYLKYSKHGYEIAVVGDSPNTARYAGMKVGRIVVRTIFLSAASSAWPAPSMSPPPAPCPPPSPTMWAGPASWWPGWPS